MGHADREEIAKELLELYECLFPVAVPPPENESADDPEIIEVGSPESNHTEMRLFTTTSTTIP